MVDFGIQSHLLLRLAPLFSSAHISCQQLHYDFESMLTKTQHCDLKKRAVFAYSFMYTSPLSRQAGVEWHQFFIIGRRNDESCVTHSPPQVGVDNLDKYARSFALFTPLIIPTPRAQTVQLRWPEVSHNKWAAGNNLSLLVMRGTSCVTVRPGLSTLHVNWRQSSMWSSVLQRPESAQSVPHRNKCCPSSCLSTDFHRHLPSW